MAARTGLRLMWLAPLMLVPACAHSPVRTAASSADCPQSAALRARCDQRQPLVAAAAACPVQSAETAARTPAGTDVRPASASLPHAAGPPLDAAATAAPLSLDDLERIALENNPSLAQLTAVVHKAQGVQRQVGLPPNPTLGYFGDEIGADGTAGQQGGYLAQTIVTGGKLRLNRAAAAQNVEQLLWELEAQRSRVINDVRIQFYETLGAERRLELTRELELIAEQAADASRRLRDAQRVADIDVLQAEIQLGEVRILAGNAEAEYAAAWRKLAALVGRPELFRTPLAGTLDGGRVWRIQNCGDSSEPHRSDLSAAILNFPHPTPDFDDLWPDLQAASPELLAARVRIHRALAQLQRERAQPVPNIVTQLSVTHDYASGDELVGLQVGLPLPVFNRNQGSIDAAAAEYHRSLHEARRLELALRNRLADAFQQYQQARQQAGIYDREILPKARETLELTAQGYELGRLDLLRVLSARQVFFQSSLAAVRAQVALRQAEVALSGLLLTGGLNDVPDIAIDLGGPGNRDRALSGQ